jgi:hypothetical protein
MSITVGFSTPKKWMPLSWAIKALTKSEASHAWLLVDDPIFGLRVVMDAHLSGFRLIPFEHFLEKNRVLALAVPTWDLSVGVSDQVKDIGDGYDYLGLAGMLYVTLMWKIFHKAVKNPFRTKTLFCSEAVVRVLQASKYPDSEAYDSESVWPGELMEFFSKSPHCDFVAGDRLKL